MTTSRRLHTPKRLRRSLASTLAVVLLVAPMAALAEPAVIAVFEAVARAEPKADGAPVQSMVEGTAVSVSEEATAGWRRVRLSDGRTAWIEERALAFPARGVGAAVQDAPPAGDLPDPEAPPPPSPARVKPSAPPDLRARIYVRDLDHLAELVKSDTRVGPMADQLVGRGTTGLVIGGLGLATSAGFLIAGIAHWNDPSRPPEHRYGGSDRSTREVAIGALIGTASLMLAKAILPTDADLLEVVNAWNEGHPDRPLAHSAYHLSR